MDANEAQKHAHAMVGALRCFAEAEQVLKAAAQADNTLSRLRKEMSEAEAELGKTRRSLKSARDRLGSVEEEVRVKNAEVDASARRREKALQDKLLAAANEAQAKTKELLQAGKIEKVQLDKDLKKGHRELRKLEEQISTARGQLAGLGQTVQGQMAKLSA